MRRPFWLLLLIVVLIATSHPVLSQTLSGQDRDRALIMLKAVRDDIRKNYYDAAFHGGDLDARMKFAEERIKQAQSNGEVFGVIAQILLELNDSHTKLVFEREHRSYEVNKDILIWRLPAFDLDDGEVDDRIDKAKKYKTLIIDLRRNSGGAVDTLQRLVGNLFDHDITIGNMQLRKEAKPMVARTRGNDG